MSERKTNVWNLDVDTSCKILNKICFPLTDQISNEITDDIFNTMTDKMRHMSHIYHVRHLIGGFMSVDYYKNNREHNDE